MNSCSNKTLFGRFFPSWTTPVSISLTGCRASGHTVRSLGASVRRLGCLLGAIVFVILPISCKSPTSSASSGESSDQVAADLAAALGTALSSTSPSQTPAPTLTGLTWGTGDSGFSAITGSFTLPSCITSGGKTGAIVWTIPVASKALGLAGFQAMVNRQSTDTSATLSAKVTYGGSTSTAVNFTVLVKLVAHDAATTTVNAAAASFTNPAYTFVSGDSVTNITSNFAVPTRFEDLPVTWQSNSPLITIDAFGKATVAPGIRTDVTLTATLTCADATATAPFTVTVVDSPLAGYRTYLTQALLDSLSVFSTAKTWALTPLVTDTTTQQLAGAVQLPTTTADRTSFTIQWTTDDPTTLGNIDPSTGNLWRALPKTVTATAHLIATVSSSTLLGTVSIQFPVTVKAVSQAVYNMSQLVNASYVNIHTTFGASDPAGFPNISQSFKVQQFGFPENSNMYFNLGYFPVLPLNSLPQNYYYAQNGQYIISVTPNSSNCYVMVYVCYNKNTDGTDNRDVTQGMFCVPIKVNIGTHS